MASNAATEEEISESISRLLERKHELTLLRYVNSLAPHIDSSSLLSGDAIRSQCDILKSDVGRLINIHEGNIDSIVKVKLGLAGEDDFGQVEGPAPRNRDRGRQPPSAMARKFLAAEDDDVWKPDMDTIAAHEATVRAGKETYFFYGTLMDPRTLQRILGLKERPQMKPAVLWDTTPNYGDHTQHY